MYLFYVQTFQLDVSPDFQRGNIWTEKQKIRFIEHWLRGGMTGTDIYINAPYWHTLLHHGTPKWWMVLVDGKQRLDAALGFLNNEFPVFGAYYREYTDAPRIHVARFNWHINDLETREECLQWYLDLNSGGTVHSEEDLQRVRDLLSARAPYTPPPPEEVYLNARLDRAVLQETMAKEAAESELKGSSEDDSKAYHSSQSEKRTAKRARKRK